MNDQVPLDRLDDEGLSEVAVDVVDDVEVRDLGFLVSAASRPTTTALDDDAERIVPSAASGERDAAALSELIGRHLH